MRQLYMYMLVALIMASLCVTPAVAVKIKHRDSVYADSAGVPLSHPEGVACGADFFIVADTENSRLVRYAMTPQGLTADAVFPLAKTTPLIARLSTRGEIYVLDGKARTLIKLSQDGQVMGRVEPQGVPGGKTYVPRSFALDSKDNIYLLDIFSARVLVLDAAGTYLRQYPFPAGYSFFSDLAFSPSGALYLLDSVAGAIYVAEPGAESFVLFTGDLKEHMNFPTSLAIDRRGGLFLSDQYGSGLALVGPDGTFKGRKFGMGWEDGQLYYPAQLCINAQDSLIIADRNNNRVQVFSILED